jgi:hypothetical protein
VVTAANILEQLESVGAFVGPTLGSVALTNAAVFAVSNASLVGGAARAGGAGRSFSAATRDHRGTRARRRRGGFTRSCQPRLPGSVSTAERSWPGTERARRRHGLGLLDVGGQVGYLNGALGARLVGGFLALVLVGGAWLGPASASHCSPLALVNRLPCRWRCSRSTSASATRSSTSTRDMRGG